MAPHQPPRQEGDAQAANLLVESVLADLRRAVEGSPTAEVARESQHAAWRNSAPLRSLAAVRAMLAAWYVGCLAYFSRAFPGSSARVRPEVVRESPGGVRESSGGVRESPGGGQEGAGGNSVAGMAASHPGIPPGLSSGTPGLPPGIFPGLSSGTPSLPPGIPPGLSSETPGLPPGFPPGLSAQSPGHPVASSLSPGPPAKSPPILSHPQAASRTNARLLAARLPPALLEFGPDVDSVRLLLRAPQREDPFRLAKLVDALRNELSLSAPHVCLSSFQTSPRLPGVPTAFSNAEFARRNQRARGAGWLLATDLDTDVLRLFARLQSGTFPGLSRNVLGVSWQRMPEVGDTWAFGERGEDVQGRLVLLDACAAFANALGKLCRLVLARPSPSITTSTPATSATTALSTTGSTSGLADANGGEGENNSEVEVSSALLGKQLASFSSDVFPLWRGAGAGPNAIFTSAELDIPNKKNMGTATAPSKGGGAEGCAAEWAGGLVGVLSQGGTCMWDSALLPNTEQVEAALLAAPADLEQAAVDVSLASDVLQIGLSEFGYWFPLGALGALAEQLQLQQQQQKPAGDSGPEPSESLDALEAALWLVVFSKRAWAGGVVPLLGSASSARGYAKLFAGARTYKYIRRLAL